jgi:hypothetical protein
MIALPELVKILVAKLELRRDELPMKCETAAYVVKMLAPDIRDIMREVVRDELAADRRLRAGARLQE